MMRDKKIDGILKNFSIDAWLESNKDYGFYFDDRYSKPDFKPKGLNCVDDLIEKNRKARMNINLAKRTKVNKSYEDAIAEGYIKLNKQIAEAHYEYVNSIIEEGISFEEAERFVSKYIDFSNMKLEEKGGKYFIVIEPKLREELFYE